jgi:hypothetical protein
MAEKIGSIDMKHIEKAKKERRFIYTNWSDGSIMLSDPSKGGGKKMDEKTIKERKSFNESVDARRKAIIAELATIRKEMLRAGSKGDGDAVTTLKARKDKLNEERMALKKKVIPKRK